MKSPHIADFSNRLGEERNFNGLFYCCRRTPNDNGNQFPKNVQFSINAYFISPHSVATCNEVNAMSGFFGFRRLMSLSSLSHVAADSIRHRNSIHNFINLCERWTAFNVCSVEYYECRALACIQSIRYVPCIPCVAAQCGDIVNLWCVKRHHLRNTEVKIKIMKNVGIVVPFHVVLRAPSSFVAGMCIVHHQQLHISTFFRFCVSVRVRRSISIIIFDKMKIHIVSLPGDEDGASSSCA